VKNNTVSLLNVQWWAAKRKQFHPVGSEGVREEILSRCEAFQ